MDDSSDSTNDQRPDVVMSDKNDSTNDLFSGVAIGDGSDSTNDIWFQYYVNECDSPEMDV